MSKLTKADIDGLRRDKIQVEDVLIDLTEPGYRWTTSPHGKAFWAAVDRYADLRQALREASDA